MIHWTRAVVVIRMTMALPVLVFPAAMAEASSLALSIRTCNVRGKEMGLLKTLIGATVGGMVGGPLGMIAGAAIVNDPSVADRVTQHDE